MPTKMKRPLQEEQVQRWGVYREVSMMGHGGMGLVYVAEHEDSKQHVIIKTLRPDNDTTYARQALIVEIQALQDLSHPNIVTLCAFGNQQDAPWMALEYLEGHTLATLFERIQVVGLGESSPELPTVMMTLDETLASVDLLPQPGLPLDTLQPTIGGVPATEGRLIESYSTIHVTPTSQQAITQLGEVIEGVCHALAYLHGEGWIHGDLTPNNIMIGPGKHVTLFDFGLATRVDRRVHLDQLKRAGMLAGTAAYLSPEQICGEALDARSDLYSLGCVLYQCVTGRLPFQGDMEQMLAAHLKQAPVAPRALGAEISEGLEDIILRLLSKAPEDRPAHVFAVLSALRQTGVLAPSITASPLESYLTPSSFVGRALLIERAKQTIQHLDYMKGTSWLVLAESGQGKSFLAFEIIRYARYAGLLVLPGGQHQESHSAPLSCFLPWLAQLNQLLSLEDLEAEQQTLTVLAAYSEALAHRLSVFLPDVVIHPNPHPQRVFDALVSALDLLVHRSGSKRGLCLVIDDLQWADALSLDALTHLMTRALPIQPWWLVCVSRPVLFESHVANASAASLFGEVDTIIELEPLSADDIRQMTYQMLGGMEPPEQLLSFLVDAADGNPLFVAEYLHMVTAQELLSPTADGSWVLHAPPSAFAAQLSTLPMPEQLVQISIQRLQTMHPNMLSIVTVLAVANGPLNRARLRSFVEPLQTFDLWVDRLIHQGIVISTSHNIVALAHASYLDAILDTMPVDARVMLHGRFIKYIERALGDGAEVDRGQLAWHLEHAGQHERAQRMYLHAAQDALAQHDYGYALRLYDSAASLTEVSSEKHTIALDRLEHVLLAQGRLQDVLTCLQEWETEDVLVGETRQLRIRRLLLHGRVLNHLGRSTEALNYLNDGTLWIDPAEEEFLAEMGKLKGAIYDCLGDYDDSLHHHNEALLLARKHSLHDLEGDLLHNRALVYKHKGDYPQARRDFESALVIYRAQSNVRRVALAKQNIGLLLRLVGRMREAAAYVKETWAYHEQYSSYTLASTQRFNYALCLADMGDLDTANGILLQLLEQPEYYRTKRTLALTLQQLGVISMKRGQLDEAHAYYVQALSILDVLCIKRVDALVTCNVAWLDCICGDVQRALERLEEIRDTYIDQLDLDTRLKVQLHTSSVLFVAGQVKCAAYVNAQTLAEAERVGFIVLVAKCRLLALEMELVTLDERDAIVDEQAVEQIHDDAQQLWHLLNEIGDDYLLHRVGLVKGQALMLKGLYDQARSELNLAHHYFTHQRCLPDTLSTQLWLVEVSILEKNADLKLLNQVSSTLARRPSLESHMVSKHLQKLQKYLSSIK